jgi:positive regulator of sigma E activity
MVFILSLYLLYSKNHIMAKNTIEHDGIVTQVADTFIIVTIQSQTACAGCHAKGACGMSEMALKSITAEKPNEEIKIGDKVIVSASTQNAMLSVLLAYIVPSVLIIVILTLLILAGVSEVMAATLSLIAISAYFICLYLLRNKFAQKIKFKVKIA